MQTEIALSTTKAEYIALSQSTRDRMPIKQMIDVLNSHIKIDSKAINTFSTAFENNNGALQLAIEPKYRPRTKHTCVKYHHFRQYVKNKTISMHAIGTDDQQADIFTKPLTKENSRNFVGLLWAGNTLTIRGNIGWVFHTRIISSIFLLEFDF